MALKPCPDCRTMVGSNAKACPKCGRKLQVSGFLLIGWLIVGIVALGAVMSMMR